MIGDYAVKEDFFAGRPCRDTFYGDIHKDIYFLPGGQRYWCYGWTKGFLLLETGDSTSANRYEFENYDGAQYLFIENKSYEYRRGGRPTVLVLRRMDRKAYTSEEIARTDDIDIPFVDDPAILGNWKAIGFSSSKEEFDPDQEAPEDQLYFKSIEFRKNGACISRYGNEIIQGSNMQVWTKGFVLRKWNRTACKYEIRVENGREYLFMEWKSGDYQWGGYDTNYYVFVREDI